MALKKPLALLAGIAFLSFVVVQYNDPDPLIWMGIYGVAALLCFLAAYDKVPHAPLWVAAFLYALGGVYMWPAHFEGVSLGGGDIRNIEEARESLGLFLCSMAFAGVVLLGKYEQRRTIRLQQLQKARWANL